MKNSWISFATHSVVFLLALLLLVVPAEGKKNKKRQKAEDLVNVFLSPEYSQWLIGPIARMASSEEISAYLALTDDAEADRFISRFWDQRGGDLPWPAKGPGQIYRERAEEADTLYREGAYRGRITDRGTIHILYGEPEEVRYEVAPPPRQAPLEVWVYPKDAPAGLDGESPVRTYYFTQEENLTVFYVGPMPRPTR